MVLKNKIIAVGLATALFSLSGCGDRGHEKIEGHILYSDGVLFGVTTDSNLNPADMYNVTSKEGNAIGNLTLDHNVYDKENQQVGNLPCAGTTDNAYDENGFLVGTCNLGISSKEANRGLSAYEIAVKHGFTGSEAQWLESLNGTDGKNGATGKNGAKGDNGTDGKDGANGTDGADGKDGLDGKDGVDGKDGATGTDGAKGDKGDQGDTGAKGDKGELPTQPEYICPAGDTDPLCGPNQEDYKVSKFIFSIKGPVTNPYNDGALATQGVVSGEVETINWQVQRGNGDVLPFYTINNKWAKGAFTSNDAPFANHDDKSETRYRLISRANQLVLESDAGDSAILEVDESGLATVINSGLAISHDKLNKEICFTAEIEACISYLVFWEPK